MSKKRRMFLRCFVIQFSFNSCNQSSPINQSLPPFFLCFNYCFLPIQFLGCDQYLVLQWLHYLHPPHSSRSELCQRIFSCFHSIFPHCPGCLRHQVPGTFSCRSAMIESKTILTKLKQRIFHFIF